MIMDSVKEWEIKLPVPIIKKTTEIARFEKPTKYHYEILLDAEIGEAYFIPGVNVQYVRKAMFSWCRNRNIELRVTIAYEEGVVGAKVERTA